MILIIAIFMLFFIKDVVKKDKEQKISCGAFVNMAITEIKRDPSYIVIFIASASAKITVIGMASFGNVLLEFYFNDKHRAEGVLSIMNLISNGWHIPFTMVLGIYADKIKIHKLLTLVNSMVMVGFLLMFYNV